MGRRYVSFSLGEGRYCMPVEQVLQIMRLETLIEIPKPPPYVEGVINLRGDIIPVVNLRARLGVADPEKKADRRDVDPRKRRVIIARLEGRSYGLDVDEVRDIVDIDEAGITSEATTMFGTRAEFVTGIARAEAGLYVVLDLGRVLGTGRELPGGRAEKS
jgi:purine-binding chemotaxis protein CheW